MRKFFIFIFLLVNIIVGKADNEIKNCNTEEIFQKSCPSSSKCVEQANVSCKPASKCIEQPETVNGVCQCKDIGYVFNSKYTNDDDYCLLKNVAETRNTSNIENSVIVAQHKKKHRTIFHPNHLLAGIIILVIIVIGLVMAFRKKKIMRHIRRTHRNPFYEDVYLGTNDHDDPPLI